MIGLLNNKIGERQRRELSLISGSTVKYGQLRGRFDDCTWREGDHGISLKRFCF